MQGRRPNYAWFDLSIDERRTRFLSNVEKLPSGCWVWTGKQFRNGYGCVSIMHLRKRMYFLAHRVAWELFIGPIPDGMKVLHKCDNHPCVRFDKCLFLGTAKNNTQDMLSKQRQNPPQGERSAQAKLTANDVLAIRQRVATGEPQKQLAQDYGVSHKQISVIISRKQWTHI